MPAESQEGQPTSVDGHAYLIVIQCLLPLLYSCLHPRFIHPKSGSAQARGNHKLPICSPSIFPAASSSNTFAITGLSLSWSRTCHEYEAQLPGLASVVFQNLASPCFIFHNSSMCSPSVSRSLSATLPTMVVLLLSSARKSYHYIPSKHSSCPSAAPIKVTGKDGT